MSRQRRTFTSEFKLQLVKLYENGKSRADIAREYDITLLDIPKSMYYYHADVCGKRALKTEDKEISKEIARIFKESRNNYGTRKIKKELSIDLIQQ
ncbi:transposase [Lysinibacillus fusiformis]|uniref:transposase n=1 Tax=Lysinibacillus fusiformis TaxID=28031 RepID=UPI00359C30A8